MDFKIKQIMTANPIRINYRETIQAAAKIMIEYRIDGLPVVDDQGQLVGIFTKTHAFKALGLDMLTPVPADEKRCDYRQ